MKRSTTGLRWDAVLGAIKAMSIGSWIVVAILLFLLGWAFVVAYAGWQLGAGTDVPSSGYVALVIGVFFSLVVGIGLMALIFYSSRYGYDEPPKPTQNDDEQTPS
jgi:hypothetical protein